MTGERLSAEPPSNIHAIKDRAADWLERSDRSEWTMQDEAELEAWLSESPANRLAYWRVKSAWERAQRLHILRSPEGISAERGGGGRFRRIVTRTVAALSVFVIIGAGALLLSSPPGGQTYSTGVGGHEIVSLADGTKIELNTDTILQARLTVHERTITLDRGEAYFQVQYDARRPFAVLAGNRRITDLGTKFIVRHEAGHFEVALVEGRARLDAPDGIKHSVVLSAGDAILEHGRSLVFVRKSASALSSELGWRRGVLVFTRATLADVTAEFNRYNTDKITIADPKTARVTIGGTFQADNVDAFAHLVRTLLGLRVEQHGNQTVISR